jgi:PspAB-like protein
MGFTDVLFGRKKLKGAKLDRLFALSSAQITLETEIGLKPAGVAAVCFKPLSAGEFARAEQEIDELLGVAAQSSGSEVRRRSDTFGFQWLVVRDRDFEDLVTTVNLVSSELDARGFGSQLLASLFAFEGGADDRRTYIVYGFKTGTFWPFIPAGEDQSRDNAAELRLKNELEGELPIEPQLERWLGLFDAPLD